MTKSGAIAPEAWDRVLLICPHPDDETVGAGILLQEAIYRGSEIRVIYLTDGERNPIAQFFFEGRWPLRRRDRERFAKRRIGEANAALTTLGVDLTAVERWHLPDQGLIRMIDRGGPVAARMRNLISQFAPTLVVTPTSRDLHLDHMAAGRLTRDALEACGSGALHITYRIHGSSDADPAAFMPPESDSRAATKEAAMECHVTQLLANRLRMIQLCRRHEAFRTWADEERLSPVRFRALQRLRHLLPAPEPRLETPEEIPDLLHVRER